MIDTQPSAPYCIRRTPFEHYELKNASRTPENKADLHDRNRDIGYWL